MVTWERQVRRSRQLGRFDGDNEFGQKPSKPTGLLPGPVGIFRRDLSQAVGFGDLSYGGIVEYP